MSGAGEHAEFLSTLAGIVSPDGSGNLDADYLLLVRATPADNRMHSVDARDAALAFANAVALA